MLVELKKKQLIFSSFIIGWDKNSWCAYRRVLDASQMHDASGSNNISVYIGQTIPEAEMLKRLIADRNLDRRGCAALCNEISF